MSKGCAGIKILENGIHWRKELLSGTPVQGIATKHRAPAQVVSRAIWLARIPEELKAVIRENPEVFTRGILINGFASKRSACEKNYFKLLRSEVLRMAKEGLGSKPKLPKKERQLKKKKLNKKAIVENEAPCAVSVTTNAIEAMTAEKQIKEALGFHCRVAFNEAGESQVTINLKNKNDLEKFIDMVTANLF
ncbi:hypothetical protein [Silvanigrella aquatica]|uniref:Uncharacterized protein n=1 Tax=Silvanigrella aquatica TaxID=1915309 RepID=A0A1L4D1H7_9BACT|nr:hypothetical protein [Silvanigrella aquatica]APJ04052.1 hypothetical protein AXG55_09090 [Silvanigrella aquatica]